MSAQDQFSFDALLAEASETNAKRAFDKKTAHLPDTTDEAVAYHTQQIDAHHAAMLDCDFDAALAIRTEAHLLAKKLNGGAADIVADDTAPGCVLANTCAADPGIVPLWGQDGQFEIDVRGVACAIMFDGMFGIGGCHMPFLGFEAYAADPSAPFISHTGYRSFLGCAVPPEQGMTPDRFAERVIEAHIANHLRG